MTREIYLHNFKILRFPHLKNRLVHTKPPFCSKLSLPLIDPMTSFSLFFILFILLVSTTCQIHFQNPMTSSSITKGSSKLLIWIMVDSQKNMISFTFILAINWFDYFPLYCSSSCFHCDDTSQFSPPPRQTSPKYLPAHSTNWINHPTNQSIQKHFFFTFFNLHISYTKN